MRTLPIPIDSDSTVKEPHEWHVPYEHKFFRIIKIKNEWNSLSMDMEVLL